MRNVARLKTPRRTCMHAQPALSSTTIKTPPLLFFTSPREASVICTCTMLLLRYTTAKSTVARSLRNPALNTIHVFGRLCSTTSEYCCRPQTTLIRRYHHEAVIGHAPFPQQYRHYSSSSIDHKIPAVFVDASKNAGIWEQDWRFVVYRASFSDSDVWERFKETFSRINDRSFDKLVTFYSNPDDVRVSQRFWRCRFVDEPGLEGKDPATIRE
jgi:hypothetical protein